MRAAWDKTRDNLESGTCLHILQCVREPTAVAEANTKQAFVDILDNDVIEPLTTFKVSQVDLVRAGIPVLITGRTGRFR
jgi:hypothetical protein